MAKLHSETKDWTMLVPLDLLKQQEQTQNIFTIVMSSIAGISLLVGGIGIMNIMLANVYERRKEIGTRRALGAQKSDIIRQFLFETIFLTSIGGATGVALGVLIALLVTHYAAMPTAFSIWFIVLALLISAVIGVLFGTYPAWKAGFSNEFSYKNFRVSILFDGQWGGIVYSQTHHKMTEHGTLKHTLKYRENPNFEVVGEGVMLDERGQYVPNNVPISVSKYYADYWRRANVETNSFDASFLKLREARIEYTIPSAGLNKIGIERLTLALYGRNLAMWTKDFPVYDPEVATLNNGTIVPGSEMGQLPSTRTMGFNLTLKF